MATDVRGYGEEYRDRVVDLINVQERRLGWEPVPTRYVWRASPGSS